MRVSSSEKIAQLTKESCIPSPNQTSLSAFPSDPLVNTRTLPSNQPNCNTKVPFEKITSPFPLPRTFSNAPVKLGSIILTSRLISLIGKIVWIKARAEISIKESGEKSKFVFEIKGIGRAGWGLAKSCRGVIPKLWMVEVAAFLSCSSVIVSRSNFRVS